MRMGTLLVRRRMAAKAVFGVLRSSTLACLTATALAFLFLPSFDRALAASANDGGHLRRNVNRMMPKSNTAPVNVDASRQQERELIVGGTDAEFGRFPWFVALANQDNETICGGTLIAPDIVLTAAHCSAEGVKFAMVGKYYYDMNNTSDLYERINVLNPYEMGATADFMERNKHAIVSNTGFVHPYHSYRERTYDVMLMKLASPSTKGSLIKVNFDPTVPSRRSGNEISVIGMGRIDVDGPKPDVLQQVFLDFVPYDDCIDMRSYNVDYKYEVMPDMICSSGNGIYGNRGQCYGDSGGPYLVLDSSNPEGDLQIGVVSWAVNCANPVLPMVGARTSMAHTATFIRHVSCEIGTNVPSYLCDVSDTLTITESVINSDRVATMVNPVQLSVNLYFDPYPHEIAFQIWNADKSDVYAAVSFEEHVGIDHAIHRVMLPADEQCIFSIYDARDDGVFGDEEVAAYEITFGNTVIARGNGNFTSTRDEIFRVPNPSNTGSLISIDGFPTADAGGFGRDISSGNDRIPVFVSFDFDQYHEDLSWSISDPVIVSLVYKRVEPNTYKFGTQVREEVFLPAGRSFVLTVNDRKGTDDFRAIQSYRVSYFDDQTGKEIILVQSEVPFEGESETKRFSLPSATGSA